MLSPILELTSWSQKVFFSLRLYKSEWDSSALLVSTPTRWMQLRSVLKHIWLFFWKIKVAAEVDVNSNLAA